MIRFIAAIDSHKGIANDQGIPWYGLLTTDVRYYEEKILSGGDILMGYTLYLELSRAYPGRKNFVATHKHTELRSGFEVVRDAHAFLEKETNDVWNIGGAALYASTFDLADELYLTRIDKDFHCTKFFPEFEDQFSLISQTKPQTENDIVFHFEVWKRKP